MSDSHINIGDRKPRPAPIGDEYLSVCIPIAKTSNGVPTLMTVNCRDIQVYDFEYIAVSEFVSTASVGVGIV